MTVNGQTHAKRAREFALKERRAQKQAKKEARLAAAAGEAKTPDSEAPPASATEWIQ